MRAGKYLIVLIITSAVFFSGLALGEYLATKDVNRILILQEDLQNSVVALNLQSELLETDICKINVFDITEEKFELGRQLAILESQLGYDDPAVLRLKNKYSLYSIQQYVLIEKQKSSRPNPSDSERPSSRSEPGCADAVEPILFFYDNVDALTSSRTQGYVLDYVYRENREDVAVFAFSVNVHNAAQDTLMEKYGIDATGGVPAIVVNGETFEGVTSSKKILSALGLN